MLMRFITQTLLVGGINSLNNYRGFGSRHHRAGQFYAQLLIKNSTKHEIKIKTPVDIIVKLRQGSGKDRQGMALKAKGLKA